jgi:hypothetical protein
MEIGSRQILHHNVTAHPTAEWTLQQFRETLPGDHPYRFAIHDRDSIFAAEVDKGLENLGGGVLLTPQLCQLCHIILSIFLIVLSGGNIALLAPSGVSKTRLEAASSPARSFRVLHRSVVRR